MERARNRRGGSLMVQTKTENAMKGISHNFKLKVGHIGSSFIFSASHIIYIWGKSLATYLFCISLSVSASFLSLSHPLLSAGQQSIYDRSSAREIR